MSDRTMTAPTLVRSLSSAPSRQGFSVKEGEFGAKPAPLYRLHFLLLNWSRIGRFGRLRRYLTHRTCAGSVFDLICGTVENVSILKAHVPKRPYHPLTVPGACSKSASISSICSIPPATHNLAPRSWQTTAPLASTTRTRIRSRMNHERLATLCQGLGLGWGTPPSGAKGPGVLGSPCP